MGVDRTRRCHRDHAGDRSLSPSRRPSANTSRSAHRVIGMGRLRPGIRRGHRYRLRQPSLRRIHQWLPDREVAQRRQRVRVVDALYGDGNPDQVPTPRAVLGNLWSTHAARHICARWQCADQQVLVAVARVRIVPRVHRRQGDSPPRRRRNHASQAWPGSAVTFHAGDRHVRWPQVLHSPKWPPSSHSPVCSVGGH